MPPSKLRCYFCEREIEPGHNYGVGPDDAKKFAPSCKECFDKNNYETWKFVWSTEARDETTNQANDDCSAGGWSCRSWSGV